MYVVRHDTTPTGFEPVRAEPTNLAGWRLNHSAKVSVSNSILSTNSATGNRTPGICVTGRDVTNYTIADVRHEWLTIAGTDVLFRLS